MAPAGNAQIEIEGQVAWRFDGYFYSAVPWVRRFLPQLYWSSANRDGSHVPHVQHHVDIIVAVCIGAMAHAGQVTHDIGRAAGAIEPRHAVMLADRAERVVIKEAVAC